MKANVKKVLFSPWMIPVWGFVLTAAWLLGLGYVADPLFSDASDHNRSGFGTPSAVRLLAGENYGEVAKGLLPGAHFPLSVKPWYYVLKTDADVAANAVHVNALTDSLKPLDAAQEKAFGEILEKLNESLFPVLNVNLDEPHVSWNYTGHPDFENVPVFFYPEHHIVVYFLDSLRCRGRYLRQARYASDPAVY